MFIWITANLATIIPLLVLGVVVGLIIARLVKNKRAGKPSCSSCSGCAMSSTCHPQQIPEDRP